MESVTKLISALGWPQITFLSILIFMLIFRKAMTNLISGIKSVSKDGITVNQTNIDLQMEDKKKQTINELLSIESSPITQEIEKSINEELKTKGLNIEGDAVKVLLKHLAATQLELDFERIYNAIFGSQIHLLKKLNENSGTGRPIQFVDEFFLNVKNTFEEFNDWNREKYCQFLIGSSLIILENNSFNITIKGNEFLTWIMKRGKTEERSL